MAVGTEAGAKVGIRGRLKEVEVNFVARWLPYVAVNAVTATFVGHMTSRHD